MFDPATTAPPPAQASGGKVVPQAGKYAALHGLRGLAAIAIVLFHLVWVGGVYTPNALNVIAMLFASAVQFFFVLSGFSLTASHFARPAPVGAYLAKRYFRLAPLFALLVVFNLAIADTIPSFGVIVLNLTLLFGFTPGFHVSLVDAGWSIGVETVFYLLLPTLLLAFGKARAAAAFFVATLIVGYLAGAEPLQPPAAVFPYVMFAPLVHLPCFAAGILACLLVRESGGRHLLVALLALSVTLIGLCAYLLNNPNFASAPTFEHVVAVRSDPIVNSVLALAFGLVCFWQAAAPSGLLSNRLMQFFGDRSYSIYLLHIPIIRFLNEQGVYARIKAAFAGVGDWAYLPCALATLIVLLPLVEATYRAVELPGIAMGRKFAAHLSARGRIA